MVIEEVMSRWLGIGSYNLGDYEQAVKYYVDLLAKPGKDNKLLVKLLDEFKTIVKVFFLLSTPRLGPSNLLSGCLCLQMWAGDRERVVPNLVLPFFSNDSVKVYLTDYHTVPGAYTHLTWNQGSYLKSINEMLHHF